MKKRPCYSLIICFLSLHFSIVWGNWVVTRTVREEVVDVGPDIRTGNQCEFGGEDGETPLCAERWEDNGVQSGSLETLGGGCEYFRKTRVFQCRQDLQGSAHVTCERRSHYYQLRSECYGKWLRWQPCSNHSSTCKAGATWRYQFHSSSEFKFQVRPCPCESCPRWTAWEKTPDKCRPDCTQFWKRDCFSPVTQEKLRPQECEFMFGGPVGNETHTLAPCVSKECPSVRQIRLPESVIPTYPPPPVPEPPRSDCLQSEQIAANTSLLATGGFWVGFCVGAVVTVAVFVFVSLAYLRSRRGRATFAAIKTYRDNEKRYYTRKRRNDNNTVHTNESTPSHSRSPLNRAGNDRDFDAKTIESISSIPSWRRDDGYRSYPNTGSISGTSKYQESLNLSAPSYGPFYTPSGQSKLLNPNRRPLPVPMVDELKRGALSSDGVATDSDSDFDPLHPPHWDDADSPTASINLKNGAFYYEKHFNSQSRQRGEFNEDSYMRSYRRYRAKKKHSSPEKRPPSEERPQSPAESSKASSIFEKVTRSPVTEKPNSVTDEEKKEELDMSEHLQVELPREEEVTHLSDAETQRWVSDAEKSRPTTIAESGGQPSDTDMPHWPSDAEKSKLPEKPESHNSDEEIRRWASDARRALPIPTITTSSDAESQASSQPWTSDAERSRPVTNQPRRIAEVERPRWGSDTERYRPAPNNRPRRTSTERSHQTTQREYRGPGERPRRTSTEQRHRASERPRRTSEERSHRPSEERQRRTSAERRTRATAERQRRPSAERSRWVPSERNNRTREEQQRPSAERTRKETQRPRGPSADRRRNRLDVEKLGGPQRRPEGGREPQEDPPDYRYAKLQKRPDERGRSRTEGSVPQRAVGETRRLDERINPSSRVRNQEALDFPPPPPGF